jgi:hypothetical protein
MVAPAWLRGWSTINLKGDEIKGSKGFIIHGGKDDNVPLKHSVILSKMSERQDSSAKNVAESWGVWVFSFPYRFTLFGFI